MILASSLTTVKTSSRSSVSKDAAIEIGIGNTVAFPCLPTPWRASFHQLYFLMPSLSTAGDSNMRRGTFSSIVRRLTRSSALSRGDSVLSIYAGWANADAAAIKSDEIRIDNLFILLSMIECGGVILYI